MDEEYLISETQQLRAVSNPLRMRMLEQLIDQQRTATQLGGVLGMAPSRAHYHLKQLEAAGLCRLVEQRERSGIVEKYYRAVAGRFRLARTVSTQSAVPVAHAPADVRSQVEDLVQTYLQQLAEREPDGMRPDTEMRQITLRLHPQRYERMLARLRALLLEFDSDNRDNRPGVREYRLVLMAYPTSEDGLPPAPGSPR